MDKNTIISRDYYPRCLQLEVDVCPHVYSSAITTAEKKHCLLYTMYETERMAGYVNNIVSSSERSFNVGVRGSDINEKNRIVKRSNDAYSTEYAQIESQNKQKRDAHPTVYLLKKRRRKATQMKSRLGACFYFFVSTPYRYFVVMRFLDGRANWSRSENAVVTFPAVMRRNGRPGERVQETWSAAVCGRN